MALIQSTAIPSGATDYELEQSLRFNDDDSPYLSWTPSSAGNRKAWTFSCWVKRSNLVNGEVHILGSGTGNSGWTEMIRFDTSGKLTFVIVASNDVGGRLTTNALFRDTSSWYHIIGVWDSANSTASDRIRLYVNGSRLSSFHNETLPSQNLDSFFINNTNIHALGLSTYNNAGFLDGYLAEVNFIDGQALTPADFGETGTYGEWKPKKYSGTYGTNGFYLNFAGGGVMSATGGNSTVTDGDYKAVSFTSDGTFTPSANGYVEYLIIGGGGGGGQEGGGPGGGAGGYLTGMIPVTASTAYSIVVGDGGAGGSSGSATRGANGEDSTAFGLTAKGGGGGYTNQNSIDGGGSGAGGSGNTARAGGSGTAGQGNDGGPGGDGTWYGGGGGGAGAVGGTPSGGGGNGGAGLASSITGSSVTRAGGGGGGTHQSGNTSSGGSGGGGAGGDFSCNDTAVAGTANTGSGGGGAGGQRDVCGVPGGAGGSGIVIIRYKFQ